MASTASQQAQPQPSYILRGHGAQIHSTSFIRSNTRLLTGDADGWIVSWSLEIKRPVAVWKAHEGSILGILAWGANKIITHGKDNKLIVWKLSEDDEKSMSVVLPVDTPPEPRAQPWILHLLQVNTMNFCSFAMSPIPLSESSSDAPEQEQLLIAVPNTLTSETVDIFHLPSAKRIHTVPNHPTFKGGMIMAISLFHHPLTHLLTVISGYESGHTTISHLTPTKSWKTIYISQPHSQPILSLQVDSTKTFYITSSADATLAKHTIASSSNAEEGGIEGKPIKVVQTRHSGQQSLKIRNDDRIFATAGWDSKVRVYSTKGMKELAVLKWHKEGCFAVAFADVVLPESTENLGEGEKDAGDRKGGIVKSVAAMTVKEERIWKARSAHWIAVGSKDGKVSLWDIY